jgi:PAS domain S-box-containing protein
LRRHARKRYLVVEYIEPMYGYEGTRGYDVLSYAPQARAFDAGGRQRARRRQRDAAAAAVPRPDRRRAGDAGLPARRGAARRRGAPRERARRHRGGARRCGADRQATWPGQPAGPRRHAAIELAGMGEGGMRTAYRYDRMGRRAMPAWHGWLGEESSSVRRPFEVAGQRWELRLAGRSTDMGGGAAPLAVLVLGCLLSAALAAWVRSRILRAGQVEALVERRTADLEQALGQMNLYLRAIDASANAVILVDATRPGYPIDYVNPAFERMRGFSAAEAVGRRLFDVAEHEPDQAAVAGLLQAMREHREGHATMRLRCKDGRELYAEVYVAPVLDEGGGPATSSSPSTTSAPPSATRPSWKCGRATTADRPGQPRAAADRIEAAIALAGSDAACGWPRSTSTTSSTSTTPSATPPATRC